ncbi:aminotransferase class I/II-fold pyridoxal phosphate-dependent enzyme [Bacillus sp. AK128]
MNQDLTPLFDALIKHVNKQSISLHVPGHKNGQVFLKKGYPYFSELLKLDVTELTGLDDLHEPAEAIKEAEKLLANLYGAEKSFFLVNGTTVGNLSMILGVCSINDTVLVQRNCHKSIMNGLIIAGVKPVFLIPEHDEESDVQSYVHLNTITKALDEYSEVKAIILTNPNYYGHTYDLTEIVKLAHSKGIPVIVDEAHGAHYGVGTPFPESALKSGADVVVQSAHKTLPAMTMGSYLHFQSKLIPIDKIVFYLRSLQSSSPSYPIMASLDLARAYLAKVMNDGIEDIYEAIQRFKAELGDIPQICVVQSSDPEILQDPLKLIIQSRCQLTGYQLQAILEQTGIYTELADSKNVLCIMPLHERELGSLLLKIKVALHDIATTNERKPQMKITQSQSIVPYSFYELKSMNTRKVPIEECVNQVAAQSLVPYPPGIPLILQGELITEAHLLRLTTLMKQGAKIQGLNDNVMNIYDGKKEENV